VRLRSRCLPTAVGSFPHRDPGEALDLILSHLPEIPVWPQLPNRGFRENMYVQFAECLPAAVFDEAGGRLFFDTAGDIYPALEGFLERVVLEDVEYFAVTPEFAAGLHALMERMRRARPGTLRWLKGQVTGPISFGLTITDEAKRAILYHDQLYEAVLKGCVMTARWQARTLKGAHPDVIVFVDEPYLSAFGSAFINIPREQVVANLTEVVEGIHREGGLAGVHCCGNTDWSILMETPVDILNFDAYEYLQGMTLYSDALGRFVGRGGVLAWGIVPSSEAVLGESVESLAAGFEEAVQQLARKGIDRDQLLEQSLLTPSCGVGGRSPEIAARVLAVVAGLSHAVRETYGLS